MKKFLFYIILLVTLVLFSGASLQVIFKFFREPGVGYKNPNDKYEPALKRLNSLDKLVNFVDSLAFNNGLTEDSLPEYVDLMDSVVRMRFYHGLQNYAFSENWIANLMGKYIWRDFAAKVLPNDILKGQKAFCSQSSIVFQELAKKKGFDVRAVLLQGHFCSEVLLNGNWQFHDVSFKPKIDYIRGFSTDDLLQDPKNIRDAYIYSFDEEVLSKLPFYFDENKVKYGPVNKFAASRMGVFQKATKILSLYGWLFGLTLLIIFQKVFLIKRN